MSTISNLGNLSWFKDGEEPQANPGCDCGWCTEVRERTEPKKVTWIDPITGDKHTVNESGNKRKSTKDV